MAERREHPSPLPTRPCYTSPSGMVERMGQMSKVRKSSGRGQESHLPQRYLPDGSRKTILLLFSSFFFFLEEERECGNLRDWVQPDSLDSILLGVGSLHGGSVPAHARTYHTGTLQMGVPSKRARLRCHALSFHCVASPLGIRSARVSIASFYECVARTYGLVASLD